MFDSITLVNGDYSQLVNTVDPEKVGYCSITIGELFGQSGEMLDDSLFKLHNKIVHKLALFRATTSKLPPSIKLVIAAPGCTMLSVGDQNEFLQAVIANPMSSSITIDHSISDEDGNGYGFTVFTTDLPICSHLNSAERNHIKRYTSLYKMADDYTADSCELDDVAN